jgi:hypothetical protein
MKTPYIEEPDYYYKKFPDESIPPCSGAVEILSLNSENQTAVIPYKSNYLFD